MRVPYTIKLVFKHGFAYIRVLLFYGVVVKILSYLTFPQFRKYYGDFHFDKKFDLYPVEGFDNYTGALAGTMNYFLRNIDNLGEKRVLLAGEGLGVKSRFVEVFGFKEVKATGIGKKEDYNWNFEEDPPKGMGDYDIVISQAILEHLINPYKHMVDLAKLTRRGGYLMFQAVLPGFGYHRVPIDCFRFYPDWFEEVAKRLKLKVVDKGIYHSQICYMYQKR